MEINKELDSEGGVKALLISQNPVLANTDLMLQIIGSASDAIIVIDETQAVILFNKAAEQVFGYKASDILGRSIQSLLPEPYRIKHQTHVQNFAKSGEMIRVMYGAGMLKGQRASGEIFPIEASISRTVLGDRAYFSVILRDVSEKDLLEKKLMRQFNSLNTLHQVTLAMLDQRDIDDLLQYIVDQSVALLDVSYCEILLLEGEEFVAQAFTHAKPFQTRTRFGREAGRLSWQALDKGHPVVVEDYSTWEGRDAIYEDHEFHAAATFPLQIGSKTIGILGVTRCKKGHRFTEDDLLIVTRLAAIAALAIENSRLYFEVKKLSLTDELTGAHNRRSLLEIGIGELKRSQRYDRPLTVLMLDVDHFKSINDTWGHPAGDVILSKVVQELLLQVRHSDAVGRYHAGEHVIGMVGRFGGEEFVILLPETDLRGGLVIAERVRSLISQLPMKVPISSNEGAAVSYTEVYVTVSIGVSTRDANTGSFDDLLMQADLALYEAKKQGRNCVMEFNKNGCMMKERRKP